MQKSEWKEAHHLLQLLFSIFKARSQTPDEAGQTGQRVRNLAAPRPRLHYRLLALCPAPTDPVPRGLLTLWARAGMCVCIYEFFHSPTLHPIRVSLTPYGRADNDTLIPHPYTRNAKRQAQEWSQRHGYTAAALTSPRGRRGHADAGRQEERSNSMDQAPGILPGLLSPRCCQP